MVYTVGREAESLTSRNKKPVEKLEVPLWLEVNLGREKVRMAGTVIAAGALAHWKGRAALCRCLNRGFFLFS